LHCRRLRNATHWLKLICSDNASGGGVTVLDPITASQITTDDVVLRHFEPTIEYEIALVRPTNRPHSLLANEFCTRLQNELEGLLDLKNGEQY
jgi:hypothetical protein